MRQDPSLGQAAALHDCAVERMRSNKAAKGATATMEAEECRKSSSAAGAASTATMDAAAAPDVAGSASGGGDGGGGAHAASKSFLVGGAGDRAKSGLGTSTSRDPSSSSSSSRRGGKQSPNETDYHLQERVLTDATGTSITTTVDLHHSNGSRSPSPSTSTSSSHGQDVQQGTLNWRDHAGDPYNAGACMHATSDTLVRSMHATLGTRLACMLLLAQWKGASTPAAEQFNSLCEHLELDKA